MERSIWNEEAQKVLAFDDRDGKELLDFLQGYPTPAEEPKQRWICGLRRRWFYAAVCSILVILTAGLAAGLGASLSSLRARSSPRSIATSDFDIGGTLDSAYYSKSGAFNGSGFGLSSQTVVGNGDGSLVLYFQHHDSTIRWTSLSSTGWAWDGGSISEIVASDAKNNTPISCAAWAVNSTSKWHVFYVDKNNQVRERVKTNATSFLENGALANSGVGVFDSDQVAMQVLTCLRTLAVRLDCTYGMLLTIILSSNLAGGMAIDTVSSRRTEQASIPTLVSDVTAGTLKIWAKNTTTSISANSTYPINGWVDVTPADSEFDKMHPSTSISFTNVLYAQTSANVVRAWNVTWDYVNTSIETSFQLEDHPGIPGTHLAATTIPDGDGGDELLIFYQTIGNDISASSRDYFETEWSEGTVPVSSS